ncbi:hypothetical protein QBC47DRAFT_142536 [Echria macrotheca]|uniref:Transcription elongation factor Eaf N-terminal domain-containing protein n=1 Tax=Echria macrotheca TaxID=438768 RepID=A0AAJ0FET1_9PEZI|nr:hypothetical protein QBC47DRAFT_142536 [Echria macrotheca]
MAAQAVDPTKAGKYPIILSDALLGKASKESFTGIRYNHRPTLSSETAPASARLKRSAREGTFNLGFDDKGDKYQYNGVRTTDDGNYILVFDPTRQAFVLHRLDSMFHMNITKTPDSNAEALRKKFPQLEIKSGESSKQAETAKQKTTEKATPSKPAAPAKGKGKTAPLRETTAKGKKAAGKAAQKPAVTELTLPTPAPPQPKKQKEAPPPPEPEKPKCRNRSPVESEDDADGDDDILLIEDPDAKPSGFRPGGGFPPLPANNFNSAFPMRRFSEFVRGDRDEDEDQLADGEAEYIGGGEEEEEEDEFEDVLQPNASQQAYRPPSPPRPGEIEPPARFEFESGDADGDGDMDMNDDDALAAELEKEFLKQAEEEAGAQDSDVSEEE